MTLQLVNGTSTAALVEMYPFEATDLSFPEEVIGRYCGY
jgi:hypothetical protein